MEEQQNIDCCDICLQNNKQLSSDNTLFTVAPVGLFYPSEVYMGLFHS